MTGSIGVPYLIGIIIAVIALAIIIFVVYEVLRGGSWDCVKCKTQFTTWCLDCYRANVNMTDWGGGNKLGSDLYNCVNKCGYWSSASDPNQDCQNAEDACKPLILYIHG